MAARVAIFLDLSHLQPGARERGCQISFGRLIRALAADRGIIRAVAYVPNEEEALSATLAAHDIEVELFDARDIAVAVAVDAMAVAARVDCVVLASGAPSLRSLATSLRSQGLRVESASFADESAWPGQAHYEIDKQCLFVP